MCTLKNSNYAAGIYVASLFREKHSILCFRVQKMDTATYCLDMGDDKQL